jgi:hypothetical protein
MKGITWLPRSREVNAEALKHATTGSFHFPSHQSVPCNHWTLYSPITESVLKHLQTDI